MATVAYMPVMRSEIATPAFCGPPPGRSSRSPVTLMKPLSALDDEIVAGAIGVRPVLPEPRDRAIDEPRIERRDARVVEAVFREAADLVVLDQHVGLPRKVADDRLPFWPS